MIHVDGDSGAAEDTEKIGYDGEKEEHCHAGKDAWGNQLANGVNAEGAHGVYLLSDDHGAEFAGHRRGVTARHHDAGKYRAEFADHGHADKPAGDGRGAELGEGRSRLQGEYAAREEAGKQYDGS